MTVQFIGQPVAKSTVIPLIFIFIVLQHSPDSLKIAEWLNNSKIYERSNQFDSAVLETQKAIRLAKQKDLQKQLCEAFMLYGSLLGKTGQLQQSILAFNDAKKIAKKHKLIREEGRALFGIGTVYLVQERNDSAAHLLLKAMSILEKENDFENVSAIKNNLFVISKREDNLQNSLNWIKQSISSNIQKQDTARLIGNYRNLALALVEAGELDSAMLNLKKSNEYASALDSKRDMILAQSGMAKINLRKNERYSALNNLLTADSLLELYLHEDQSEQIAELETKFRTAEIERDNAVKQTQIESQQQRMIFLYSVAGFLALAIIGVYVYNEQRKKIMNALALQKEQENKQRIEDLLRQQELKSAYAMLAGQEKAHKRIAEELHDNLGSILVTLNMFADSLQTKKDPEAQKELAKKISDVAQIANEATRTISHSLNSGVLKHFGLAAAIQELTDALNESDTIAVVSHIQIEDKLDSEISLNMYRILQELINNTLKHARASRINIELTQIKDRLSLIYEDNGQGFSPEMVMEKKGMGLQNLSSRVERINGELTIDATPEKGTTIIIEIALP